MSLLRTHQKPSCQRVVTALSIAAMVIVASWAGRDHLRAAEPAVWDSELADPVVEADLHIKAGRCESWSQNDARYMKLDGDVELALGTYGFRARQAVVRIDTQRKPGRRVRHVAMFLVDARPLQGQGPVAVDAAHLLVTASTTGQVLLDSVLISRDSRPEDALIDQADQRFAWYWQRLTQPLASVPNPDQPMLDPDWQAKRQAQRDTITQMLDQRLAQTTERMLRQDGAATPEPSPTIARKALPVDRSRRGVYSIRQDSIVGRPTDQGSTAVCLIGQVRVIYEDYDSDRVVTMSAENAVLFLKRNVGAIIDSQQFNVDDVQGVYLEENVMVSDGHFTIRAPRVFYDARTDKALILDAVFYTWDMKHKVPIYVRAEKMRQTATDTWQADRATLTTSEFAVPHFSVGVNEVTYSIRPRDDGSITPRIEAKGISPEIGGTPFFWFPALAGDMAEMPLRTVTVNVNGNSGLNIQSNWDMFSLLGQVPPDGVAMRGNLDYRGEHGPAMGLNLEYKRPRMFGGFDSYFLPNDSGQDDLADREVEHDDDTRGFLHWQHRQKLSEGWELSLELAYVSDPTFLEEFFRSEAASAKTYESSIYLKRQSDDWAFTFLSQYELNSFTPQLTTLQAPGYSVEKLPELGFYQIGASLLGDRLTYYSESRLTRMRIRAGNDSPIDRGFNRLLSQSAFGFPARFDFEDIAGASGLDLGYVGRFDTRHELQAPMKAGPLDIVPYLSGRATLYDEDFEEYAGNEDRYRLLATAGLRLHTEFSRTYQNAESKLLNIYQLRHVIEPNLDIGTTVSSYDPQDLPLYDSEVEGLDEGAYYRFGVRQTFQTKRGGPGRWRNVNFLILNTDLVLRGDDAQIDEPVSRFFSYRPEFSTGGDHLYADMRWLVSDTFALVGDATYQLEDRNELAMWHIGAVFNHSPKLSSFIDYAQIEQLDTRLLSYGLTYELTRTYTLGFVQRWDLDRGESRRAEVTLERRLPRWRLLITAEVDEIDNNTSIGFVLVPEGIGNPPRLGSFGRVE